jgi:hypothetical protein
MARVTDEVPWQPADEDAISRVHGYGHVYEALGVALINDNPAIGMCPWCNAVCDFYVDVGTGDYRCVHCSGSGDLTRFMTLRHAQVLRATTDADYAGLADKRGIAVETLKQHELAYYAEGSCWWIPFRDIQGDVANIKRYYPHWKTKHNKLNLPVLPVALYDLHKLACAGKAKDVLLCEGEFDAIALAGRLGAAGDGYVIVAAPGATHFKKEWVPYFGGFKVSVLYHNDDAGRHHGERVANMLAGAARDLRILRWPAGSPKDIDELLRDPKYKQVNAARWIERHSFPWNGAD